jgi:hypothetical protein
MVIRNRARRHLLQFKDFFTLIPGLDCLMLHFWITKNYRQVPQANKDLIT